MLGFWLFVFIKDDEYLSITSANFFVNRLVFASVVNVHLAYRYLSKRQDITHHPPHPPPQN